jgi:hypothetical protein
MNFLAAAAGAAIILLLVDQPSERLRAGWVASRKKNSKAGENLFSGSDQTAGLRPEVRSKPR